MLRRRQRQFTAVIDSRLFFLAIAVSLIFASIGLRLFWLQVVEHEHWQDIATRQQSRIKTLAANRGEIFARDRTNKKVQLFPLATNKVFYEVFIVPNEIMRPQNTVDALASALDIDATTIVERVQKDNDVYEPIKHKVDDRQLELIKKIDLPGIYWREETWRYYPEKSIGGHILGYFGYQADDKEGKYGLEGFWDSALSGKSVEAVVNRSAAGNLLADSASRLEVTDGVDLVLTIDRTIQHESCQSLDRAVVKYGAVGGSLVIMEPETGRILAMCNNPNFDPNNYNMVEEISHFNNNTIYEAYEPGSVFKAFSMAAAIDDDRVSPATTYEDTGSIKYAGFEIQNSDLLAHGVQTMTEVLEKSLNTGIIFATQQMPNKIFHQYVENLGFGQKFEIDMEQEVKGDISSLKKHGEIHKATASYGQGITSTVLQLAAATNALANDGLLMKPYIIEEFIRSDGQKLKIKPEAIRQVFATETTNQITAMLVSAVDNGYGERAAVNGYFLAGKTGTAQVAEKGQYREKTNHSFIGYGPVTNPQFSIAIRLKYPVNVQFSSDSAAPLFKELASFLIDYYQIPPER